MNNKLSYLVNSIIVIFLIVWSCSPSPRYTSIKVIYGVASHYGHNDGFHGKRTANGEIYNQHSLTAAHKTFPLNTKIRVTNLDRLTKPSVILKVNDRGPYVGDRILDCSSQAAKKLGFFKQGTANVKIEVLKWGDNKYYKE
jgi:rare lipoprotein A